MLSKIKKRFSGEGSYVQIITMAFPLILSTGAWSVLHFIDRMFLTWLSPEAVAGAMPAGILNFTLASIFIGTAGYTGTFVAQYFGAKQHEMIGKILWQGIYIGLIGGIIILLFVPLGDVIFDFIGHSEDLRIIESVYFKTLCFGAAGPIISSVFAGFYSGRGKNWPVMWANTISTVVNVLLDYMFIFGKFGFPRLGVFGAALATVIAGYSTVLVYIILTFRPKFIKQFKLLGDFGIYPKLLKNILKFGLPSGIHFFLDMSAFTVFLLIVGKIGTIELAATNIAFNINTLAFMPMIGFGIAISMLVGQHIGNNNPSMAEYCIYTGSHITFLYTGTIALLYFIIPDLFLYPFAVNADSAQFDTIYKIAVVLLRFVGIYCVFDTLNIVFSSGIKGAGDTRFVMVMGVVLSFTLLVIPSFIAVVILKSSIYVAWGICTTYIIILGFSYLFRFLSGKWKSMKVIETGTSIPPNYPEFPVNELDP